MTQWETFEPSENVQGDTYKAIDHIGATIIVKVKELKDSIVTENSPNGAPGIIVDLFDLKDDGVYRDVLWMGGAMVDGLKKYTNRLLVVQLEARKSKSGRTYPAPVGVDPDVQTRAQKRYAEKGEPLAAEIGTVDADKPPF